jgi:hypothetical protein
MSSNENISSKMIVVKRVLDIEKSENKLGNWLHKKMSVLEEENTKTKAELEDKNRQLNIILKKYEELLIHIKNKNKIIENLTKTVEEKEKFINECVDTLFVYELIINRKIPEISYNKSRLRV